MDREHKLFAKLAAILFMASTLCAFADETPIADAGHTFPLSGKIYVMHKYGNENTYIYENGNLLCVAPLSNTQKQYWQFEPTENAGCYYIRNVTSGRYMQSTHITAETQVKTGATPVEYKIVQNTTDGAAPKGYYYLCSTDQTIDNSQDGTLGLNYQAGSEKIVAYHIRYNRPNSYWEITEHEYDYEAPAPVVRSEYAKRLGIYNQPCGTMGTAWLKSCTATGDSVLTELHYTATTKPSDYWMPVRRDPLVMKPDSKFTLSYEAAGMDENHAVTAYFDWDGDGIFEARHDFFTAPSGNALIDVPVHTKVGKIRMRLRLTDNGLEGAEDDVTGTIYDFPVFNSKYTSADATSIPPLLITPLVPSTQSYGLDGRKVDATTYNGVFIRNGKKEIK